jgi:hypothetical protein
MWVIVIEPLSFRKHIVTVARTRGYGSTAPRDLLPDPAVRALPRAAATNGPRSSRAPRLCPSWEDPTLSRPRRFCCGLELEAERPRAGPNRERPLPRGWSRASPKPRTWRSADLVPRALVRPQQQLDQPLPSEVSTGCGRDRGIMEHPWNTPLLIARKLRTLSPRLGSTNILLITTFGPGLASMVRKGSSVRVRQRAWESPA